MHLEERDMRSLVVAVVLVFVPSLCYAARDCSLMGGTCRYNCATDEYAQPGYYIDCEARQICCTKSSNPTGAKETPQPAGAKELPKDTGTKNMPNNTSSSSGENLPSRSLDAAAEADFAQKGGQILVCSPLKDVYANPDTLLDCGGKRTTLKNLYEESYKLIQVISAKKIIYYLERR